MSTRPKSICAFVGCVTNTESKSSRSVRLFSFPHNPKIRQKWIDACNNPKLNPKTAVICDLHIQDEPFKSESKDLSRTDSYRLHSVVTKPKPETKLIDPLNTNDGYKGELIKTNIVEFVDISGCIENEAIENITNNNKVKLYKDSSVQCNLFKEIFNQEFENYSSDFKFSIDEISKLLGITRKIDLKDDLAINLESISNEQSELLSNHSDETVSELDSVNNKDDLFSNYMIYRRKYHRVTRDVAKQNFILLPNGEGYQCEICYRKCLNLAAYYAHHDSHLQHSTICSKCGFDSPSYNQAMRHEKNCGTDIKIDRRRTPRRNRKKREVKKIDCNGAIRRNPQKHENTCEICKHKFGRYCTYMDHMNRHRNIKPYTCSCSREYADYPNFRRHVVKFECPMEGRIVPEYAPQGQAPQSIEIKEEVMRYHIGNLNNVKVENVTRVEGRIVPEYAPQGQAPQSIEIKEEVMGYHIGNLNNVKVENVPRVEIIANIEIVPSVKNISNVTIENVANRFYCPICDKLCCRRTYLNHFTGQDHLKNEKLWNEKFNKKFRCIYCKNSYEYETLLNCINHCRKVHHKIPYNQISELYENKSNDMTANIEQDNNIHQNSSEKITITPSTSTPMLLKDKYCSKCNKYFVKRIQYFDHMNIHNNTYPYICSCGTQIRFYQGFLKHIRQNQCKGKIIFPDYAPQTFAKHYNSKNDIDNKKLENNLGIKSNAEVDNFEIENSNIEVDNFEIENSEFMDVYMEIITD